MHRHPDMQASAKLNPHVSVDCVIFGFDGDEIKVLLIERKVPLGYPKNRPFRNLLLPGNLISDDEDLDTSARRVLFELTGLSDIFLEQFYAFGDPERVKNEYDADWLRSIRDEPMARVITVAYFSLVKPDSYQPSASLFAKKAGWYPISAVPPLAFDHNNILNKALVALKDKLKSQPIGFELLPEKFTLGQLQKLYELVLGRELDKRNFRRKILNKKILIPLVEKQKGVPHKQAQLFMFDKETYEVMRTSYFGFDI
ncbi:MAG: NUDIX hydrolase [Bacteroidota bacterium]|jgi:8-oxo-dGTP diphosphatase